MKLHNNGSAATGPIGARREDSRKPAIIIDADTDSLACLRNALTGWEIEIVIGATASSLARYWQPDTADFLVLGVCEDNAVMPGLCRILTFGRSYSQDFRPDPGASGPPRNVRSDAARAGAPILVLVRPCHEPLVEAALRAGAHSCLELPIHEKAVTSMLVRAAENNQPGRHTLNLQHAQCEDLWRDDGGEG